MSRRRTSHPDWPFNIPDDVPARYRPAAGELAHSLRGREEKRFHDALFIAVHDCERARAYSWPAHARRKEALRKTSTWKVAQNAADKLANYFEQHPSLEGFYPLHLASKKSGLTFKNKPPQISLPLAFAAFLRALADQPPVRSRRRRPCRAARYGALQISNAPVKLPAREVVLAITLAFRFHIRLKAGLSGEPKSSSPITNTAYMNEAAAFACAAFGGQQKATFEAAKSMLKRHKDKLRWLR